VTICAELMALTNEIRRFLIDTTEAERLLAIVEKILEFLVEQPAPVLLPRERRELREALERVKRVRKALVESP